MNAGLPTIISKEHNDKSFNIIEEPGGYLVSREDLTSLSNTLIRLAEDKELLHQMGEYNKKQFYKMYTVDKFENRWIDFINGL